MKHCPTCGAVMRPGTTTCGECGSPDDPEAVDPEDRPDRSLAREHRESHPLGAGRDTDLSDDDTRQQGDGESGDEPPGSPLAGDQDGLPEENAPGTGGRSVPLDRRALLFGSAGVLALAGGWAFFARDDNEAKAVVETFYEALDQADTERVQSLIHEGGPLGGEFSGPSQSFLEERTFTLELLSEYDRESASDNEGVREFVYFGAVVSISRTDAPEDEEQRLMAQQITVAQNREGEYLLWDFA